MREPSQNDHGVVAVLQDLQAVIEDAPLRELRALIGENPGTKASTNERSDQTAPPLSTGFRRINVELESIATRASLADRAAIQQLVSMGVFIANMLQELGAESPKLERQLRPSPEDDARPGSLPERLSTILQRLVRAGDSAVKDASRDLMVGLPDAEFLLPDELLEDEKRSGAAAVVVFEICERLIQRKLNEHRRQLLGKIAAFREVWPLLVGVPEYRRTDWVRDRMGGVELASALKLPKRIRDAESPSIFVTEIYLQLDEVRREWRCHEELYELKKLEEDSPTKELERIIEGLKGANQSRDTENKSSVSPAVYRWRSALEGGWVRKAALLPELSKPTVPQWMEAGFWLCAFLCDGDFQSFPWPASLAGREKGVGTTEGGIKKLLRDHLRTLSSRSKKARGGDTE